MSKVRFNQVAWFTLRASTALALTIAPYHLTLAESSAKLVPAVAHADSEGGGGDGGGHGGDGGGHDGGGGGDDGAGHDRGDHDSNHQGGDDDGASNDTSGSADAGDDHGDVPPISTPG